MTDRSQFILPNNQPVVELECASAFKALTPTEKLYAHHISRASWNGGLIVLVQTSPESPLIFVLLHKIFAGESIQDLKTAALSEGLSEDDFTVIIYTLQAKQSTDKISPTMSFPAAKIPSPVGLRLIRPSPLEI